MMKLFVRPLTADEQCQVEQLLRSVDAATYRHARVILLSSQEQTVAQITAAVGLCDRQVRKVLHGFTQHGIASLPRRKAPGRKRLCDPTARTALAELLRRPPSDFGIESATWTGADLAAVAKQQGIAPPLSPRTARREIQRAGYHWQQAKRWSAQEPEYERKKTAAAPGRASDRRARLGLGV